MMIARESTRWQRTRLPPPCTLFRQVRRAEPYQPTMSQNQGNIIQLEEGWNDVIKKGVSRWAAGDGRSRRERRGRGRPRCRAAFFSPLASSLLRLQAIDVLEKTLDDGFDTSFEPKEYIRIYT